ncbi:hypothetical protein WMF30_30435 [Sorangium sp. So ce134]
MDRFAPKPISADLPAKLAACPGEREPLECQYEIARAYFEANHFAEAGAIFRGVARAGSNHKLTIYAAQLYLESVNVIGSQAEPPRTACYDEMAAAVPALHASLCGSRPKPENEEFCSMLTRIEMDIARQGPDKLIIQADRGEGDTASLYRQAGEAYMAIFDRRCAFSRPDEKQKPVPPPGWSVAKIVACSQIAFNAMKSFQAAQEMDLAERARQTLLDPLHQLNRTDLAKKVAGDTRK